MQIEEKSTFIYIYTLLIMYCCAKQC